MLRGSVYHERRLKGRRKTPVSTPYPVRIPLGVWIENSRRILDEYARNYGIPYKIEIDDDSVTLYFGDA